MSDLMEKVRQLVARRRKVDFMLERARSAGANFIGIRRVINTGDTVKCVGMNNLTLAHGQADEYRFYPALSRDLAWALEVLMRDHIVVIMQ